MKPSRSLILLLFGGCLVSGCKTSGSYRWSAEIPLLGTIAVSHEVQPNKDGERVFTQGFSDEWTRPIIEWLWPVDSEEEAKTTATDP